MAYQWLQQRKKHNLQTQLGSLIKPSSNMKGAQNKAYVCADRKCQEGEIFCNSLNTMWLEILYITQSYKNKFQMTCEKSLTYETFSIVIRYATYA